MFNHHLGYSLETGFFDIYCLISPFAFFIAPFSHEEYGCAKCTVVPNSLAIISFMPYVKQAVA